MKKFVASLLVVAISLNAPLSALASETTRLTNSAQPPRPSKSNSLKGVIAILIGLQLTRTTSLNLTWEEQIEELLELHSKVLANISKGTSITCSIHMELWTRVLALLQTTDGPYEKVPTDTITEHSSFGTFVNDGWAASEDEENQAASAAPKAQGRGHCSFGKIVMYILGIIANISPGDNLLAANSFCSHAGIENLGAEHALAMLFLLTDLVFTSAFSTENSHEAWTRLFAMVNSPHNAPEFKVGLLIGMTALLASMATGTRYFFLNTVGLRMFFSSMNWSDALCIPIAVLVSLLRFGMDLPVQANGLLKVYEGVNREKNPEPLSRSAKNLLTLHNGMIIPFSLFVFFAHVKATEFSFDEAGIVDHETLKESISYFLAALITICTVALKGGFVRQEIRTVFPNNS